MEFDNQVGLNKHKVKVRDHWLSFLTGFAFCLSFAPFNFILTAYFCPVIFFYLIAVSSPKYTFRLSFLFFYGLTIGGMHWVINSIHDFGVQNYFLASLYMLAILAVIALLWALPWLLWRRIFNRHHTMLAIPGFIAMWLFSEWSREWIAGGFPGFYLGYTVVNYKLAQWGQLFGIYFVSFIILIQAFIIIVLLVDRMTNYSRVALLVILSLTFFIPYIIPSLPIARTVDVAVMQTNLGEHNKAVMSYQQRIDAITKLGKPYKNNDIILLPESTVPGYGNAQNYRYIRDIHRQLGGQSDTLVIMGGLHKDQFSRVTNSAFAINGTDIWQYNKEKLVVFGEFIPFSNVLGKVLDIFDLPHSNIVHYDKDLYFKQSDLTIVPMICYEALFPSYIARYAKDASLYINMSNDSWFGDSNGPKLHLETTRFRAIENGKPILRSTTTGLTAIIDHNGRVIEQVPPYTPAVIATTVNIPQGSTYYSRNGNTTIFIIAILLFVFNFYWKYYYRNHI